MHRRDDDARPPRRRLAALAAGVLAAAVGCTVGVPVTPPDRSPEPQAARTDDATTAPVADVTDGATAPSEPPAAAGPVLPPPRPPSTEDWSALMREGRESLRTKDLPDAERRFSEAYGLTLAFRRGDPRTASTVSNLERVARAYLKAGQITSFERVMALLAEIADDVPAARTPELAELLKTLAASLSSDDRHPEARDALKKALAILGDGGGNADASLVGLHAQLGVTYLELGDEELARYHIQLALGIAETAEGSEGPLYTQALVGKSRLELLAGNAAQAETDLLEALRISESYYGRHTQMTAAVRLELAEFYRKSGRHRDARDAYERVISIWDGMPKERYQQALRRNDYAWYLVEIGEPADAEVWAREASELLEAQGVTGQPLAAVSDTLATALRDQQKYEEAEMLYELALNEGAGPDGMTSADLAGIADHYATLLEERGRVDEAREIRATRGASATP